MGAVDNSYRSVTGDTYIDGGAIDALESVAMSGIARTTEIAKYTTGKLADSASENLAATSNAFMYASDLITGASESAFGEAILSSRESFGDALKFANEQSKSDDMVLAEGMQKTLLLMAGIAGGAMLLMRYAK